MRREAHENAAKRPCICQYGVNEGVERRSGVEQGKMARIVICGTIEAGSDRL